MSRALAAAVLVALGGCNLFNPSGKGDAPETTRDWIEQGNAQLRALDFAGAQESFGHVLAADSGSVAAWTGYAKAVSGQSLDLGFLLDEVLRAQNENRKPLWDLDWKGKERAYQSIRPVWSVLERWAVLDSQGRAPMPPDRKVERGLLTLAHSMLLLWDADEDGHLDSTKDAMSQLLFGALGSSMADNQAGGGFVPAVTADMFYVRDPLTGQPDTTRIDTAKVHQVNSILARSDAQLAVVAGISRQDTAMAAMYASVEQQNPASLSLYQASNALDDDMDGCADEEVLDGLDNDGDFLVDEDSRAGIRIPGAPAPGKQAQISRTDHVRGDRLASPSTSSGLPGQDSALKTLYYGDVAGHLEIHRPYWDRQHPAYPSMHWNVRCTWDAATAATYGVTAGCKDGAFMDTTGFDRNALSALLRRTPPGWARVDLGCQVIGGCWCRTRATLCDAVSKECPDAP